jgi:competence protein ComEC
MSKRKPALFVACAYILGIILGNGFDFSITILSALVLLFGLLSFFFFLKKRLISTTYLLILTFILAGFWMHEIKTNVFPQNHIKYFLDLNSPVILSGVVCEDPDIRPDKTFLTVDSRSIIYDDKIWITSGKVLLKIKKQTNFFNYGDFIRAQGYLYQPFSFSLGGFFDYKKYLFRAGIFGLMSFQKQEQIKIIEKEEENIFIKKIVLPVKHFILNTFRSTLDDPHRALLSGFVLGEKRGIPQNIYKMFNDTGTLHLLAISGSNVGLVILFCFYFFLLLRVPRKISFILTILPIVIFSYITGNQPSVVRASIMATLFLLGFFLEKEEGLVNILSFSALLILFFSPLSLFDVGFQLSYAATLGIILLVASPESLFSRFSKKFKGFTRWGVVIPIMVTLSATLFTYPIIAYYFKQISLYTALANLILVPSVSLAVIAGGITSISALFSYKLALIFGAFNWLVLSFILKSVSFFSNLPYANLKIVSPSYLFLFFYYSGIYFVFIWGKKGRN